jgi:hypothetical protein
MHRHEKRRIVWTGKERTKDTRGSFFAEMTQKQREFHKILVRGVDVLRKTLYVSYLLAVY